MNYDIPWNPTRVLQRIGRVNRVGTTHTEIYIYNFFPTEQSNEAIQLEENVKSKMEAFIKLLGSDAKHLTDSEEVETHDLFDKINSAEYLSGEDGEDVSTSEIKYLTTMRTIRDEQPHLFEKIKKLPRKSRTGRHDDKISQQLLTFFRKGDFLKIYLSNQETSQELDFSETVSIMECSASEPKKALNSEVYYRLLEANKVAFDESMESDDSINQ
jgi:superfamily II DNA/RNA helicase